MVELRGRESIRIFVWKKVSRRDGEEEEEEVEEKEPTIYSQLALEFSLSL